MRSPVYLGAFGVSLFVESWFLAGPATAPDHVQAMLQLHAGGLIPSAAIVEQIC